MALLNNATQAIKATAVWRGVPVGSVTKPMFAAARNADVHNITDKQIKTLGTFTEIRAAALPTERQVKLAAKVQAQASQLKVLKKENKALAECYGSLSSSLGVIQDTKFKVAKAYKPHSPTKKRTAAAVALLSDLHVEESVYGTDFGGSMNFDLMEAEERIERFFQGYQWLIKHHRSSFEIDTIVLGMLGDMITGNIHDDLAESNNLPPTHAVFWLMERLEKGIRLLLKGTRVKKLVVACCFGNHGRTTQERRIQTIATNSFEWLLYRFLQHTFEKDERVEFVIATGEFLHINVYGHTLRFTHGDAIQGSIGPVGPVVSALRKIDAWDRLLDKAAEVTCFGHHHQFISMPRLVSNGSLIGYGSYAAHIGARFEPPTQAFFLLDAEHGHCQDTPIWLTSDRGCSSESVYHM